MAATKDKETPDDGQDQRQATAPDPAPEQSRGPLQGLTVGRMVHFLRNDGQCRPAVVVRLWDAPDVAVPSGIAQLAIFCDGTNDNPYDGAMVVHGSSVPFSAEPSDTGPRSTWHWPERV